MTQPPKISTDHISYHRAVLFMKTSAVQEAQIRIIIYGNKNMSSSRKPHHDCNTSMHCIFLHHATFNHHHMSVMELGHLLTRSGLTYLEVSSEVCHDSFCQLGNSVSLSWVVCHEAFCLHVVSSSSCIPVLCLEPVLFLILLKCVNLFCNLPKCILLFFSYISSLLLLFSWRPLL